MLNKYSLASGEIAGGYGAAFFDDVMAENGETREGVIYSFSNTDANNKAVRGMMQDVVAGGSVASFFDAIQNRLDYNIRRTSNQCVLENIKDRSKHLKFARVPTGLETCAFCFMLASRGFVYWSRATAGEFDHYHSNCNCRIVPGFDDVDPDTQVEGYEPSKYYKQYEDCYKAVKDPNGSFDYDLYLKDVAKGKYGTTPDEWQRWKDNRLMNEIRSRDVNWRWTGEPVKETYIKPREELNSNEKFAVDVLKKHGFKVTTNFEDPNAPANIDFTLGEKQLWEHKNVGSGKHSAEDRMKDGAHKWRDLELDSKVRQIITLNDNDVSIEENIKRIKERMPHYADEVLVIADEKSVYRLTS